MSSLLKLLLIFSEVTIVFYCITIAFYYYYIGAYSTYTLRQRNVILTLNDMAYHFVSVVFPCEHSCYSLPVATTNWQVHVKEFALLPIVCLLPVYFSHIPHIGCMLSVV